MNIVVCIKQVPDTQKVQVDPETGVLIRDGIETKMNPYDLYALEVAFQIKKKTGAKVHVISMGPPSAEAVLKEAFSLGADAAYLMSDRRFGGADVLATSYTLSQGIQSIGDVSLILCGKQTTDGDTAQVGPAIAEYCKIPHASWVKEIVSFDENQIIAIQEMMDSTATIKMSYPCLITVEKGIVQPSLPSFTKKMETKNHPIQLITMDDCPIKDSSRYGLSGSPTQVERIFEPQANDQVVRLDFDTQTNVDKLVEVLKELKVVDEVI